MQKSDVSQNPQVLGQLSSDLLTPAPVFDCVGINYMGPILTKLGPICKPSILKLYVAVFVWFATKAMLLEFV